MKKIKTFITLLFTGVMALTTSSCGNGESNYTPADTTACPIAIENIMTRTSVRQYTGQAVPDDTLEIILKAAMAAPSAVNKQPWHFIVLKDEAKREKIGEILPGVGDKTKTAGAVVLVCGDKTRFIEEAPEYWVQDCSAATENILLAAHAYGLGAVWCGVYPTKERVEAVSRVLSIPQDVIPLNIITMGYPDDQHEPKDKWNPENIHFNKW